MILQIVLIVSILAFHHCQQFPHYPWTYNVPIPYNPYGLPQNNFVEGSYTFVDPLGIKRTIKYSSDGANGIKATIEPDPGAAQPKQNGTTPEKKETQPESPKFQFVPVPIYPTGSNGARPFGSLGSYPLGYRPPYGYVG